MCFGYTRLHVVSYANDESLLFLKLLGTKILDVPLCILPGINFTHSVLSLIQVTMDVDQLSCFSLLLSELHSSLQETILTSQVLHSCCCDFQTVLKRWSIVNQEDEEAACNISCDDSEDEDFVCNIDSVVVKAKVARGIHINKTEERMNLGMASECSTSIVKCNFIKDGYRRTHSNENKLDENKNGIHSKTEKNMLGLSDSKTDVVSKFRTCKSLQTTYQKDFSSRKLALKYSKSKGSGMLSKSKSNSLDENISSEMNIEQLLKNVTTHSSVISLASNSNSITSKNDRSKRNFPPLYKPLKEAIYIVGVPSDLLKLLSSHHRFLQNMDHNDLFHKKKIFSGSFLQKLSEMNEKSWSRSCSEPVVNLFSECADVLNNILLVKTNNPKTKCFADLEEMLILLRKSYQKVFDVESSPRNDSLCTKTVEHFVEGKDFKYLNALAGIWRNKFKASGLNSPFIFYKSKTDCKEMYENFQRIQKLLFQHAIICSLNTEVFPVLRSVETNSLHLPVIYKTCSALCNVSSLSMPVLIKL